ncbi:MULTISPECIES: GNAT family N-acetyltransferase [Methylocaldum]|jgi:RimJ/RimL family protein N-acetyltransferase|uniref:GNAT family N-acetyltransferase n=1 Tax=unclassified Methylocaldum TaxID=2622260 RepID=UPI0010606301|nr:MULTISPECIES: GNAT family protein [unclassified Methylocaldum]MBP1149925.1 RimJ/RimL family protein N-acetyltransferase [Methylocaldum sp. RMAD-M]
MTQLWNLDGKWLATAADWLAAEENYRWLDFGGDVQILTPMLLQVMVQRDIHCLRLFAPPESEQPIGIVGLSSITDFFKTATLWYVLGDKTYATGGYTTQAVRQLLDHGFGSLGLQAINAWAVEGNVASIRVLEKTGFRPIGRQRRCHRLGDRYLDRLLFDLLAHEHRRTKCLKAPSH